MSFAQQLTVDNSAHKTDERGPMDLTGLYRLRLRGFLVSGLYALTVFVIYQGWKYSAERPLTAEEGIGYWLGIAGGTMMLLLLLYPLRKHARFMRGLGPISYWFRAHMMLGILGPVCILFHSSFRLGSMNSSVALICMLIVAGSGLIGRYLYSRIHHGLYGSKASLEELRAHQMRISKLVSDELADWPKLLSRLESYEDRTQRSPATFSGSLLAFFSLGVGTWLTYLSLWLSFAHQLPRDVRRTLLQHAGARLACVRKLSEFQLYSRLFSAWHVLHLPLFLMLIFSGFIHVIAVHMY